jgi:heat shock protein HslJ
MSNPKNNPIMIVLLLALFSFASACSNQTAGKNVMDTTWQWASLVETEPASQSVVPNPENYTLILQTDGNLSIKADCNMVGGTYILDGNALTIELGASTMAFCGEQSLDQLFLEMLNRVESYTIENDQLVLILENGTGKMTFNK